MPLNRGQILLVPLRRGHPLNRGQVLLVPLRRGQPLNRGQVLLVPMRRGQPLNKGQGVVPLPYTVTNAPLRSGQSLSKGQGGTVDKRALFPWEAAILWPVLTAAQQLAIITDET